MDKTQPAKKESKKIETIATVIFVIIIAIAAVYITMPYIWTEQTSVTKSYTSYYTNVTAEVAWDLINTTSNITIIDCRGLEDCGKCQFKNQGHLPGAELNENPLSLYNTSENILVYSLDGTVGENFCKDLVNHVYGRIYNLEGGFEAWEAAGYLLDKGGGS